MIEEYRFGVIVIDGKEYNHDVEARWLFEHPKSGDRAEVLNWERAESHIIDVEDVKRAVEQKPDTIVIGTGESGVAKVTDSAKEFIKSQGIDLIVVLTGEAVRTFNIIEGDSLEEESEQNKVIGLFHLTC